MYYLYVYVVIYVKSIYMLAKKYVLYARRSQSRPLVAMLAEPEEIAAGRRGPWWRTHARAAARPSNSLQSIYVYV